MDTRNIYRHGRGYRIRYCGECYGYYHNLSDALFDRNLLRNCDWDWELFCEMCSLPVVDCYVDTRYIYCRSNGRFYVTKLICGVMCYFGGFHCIGDAVDWRDYLVLHDWKIN